MIGKWSVFWHWQRGEREGGNLAKAEVISIKIQRSLQGQICVVVQVEVLSKVFSNDLSTIAIKGEIGSASNHNVGRGPVCLPGDAVAAGRKQLFRGRILGPAPMQSSLPIGVLACRQKFLPR